MRLSLLLLALPLASPAVLHLPPVTAYALNESASVHVGWLRASVSSYNGTPAGCDPIIQFAPGDAHSQPDEALVTFCRGALPSAPPQHEQNGVTVCVPPLYSRPGADWLASWLRHYTRLGVAQFDLYSVSDAPPVDAGGLSSVAPVDWLLVPWLSSVRAWSHGQVWAMHDCLYRNRARRGHSEWGLFVDLDELLQLRPPHASLPAFLASIAPAGGPAVAASFGSVPYLTAVCRPGGELTERVAFRAEQPECRPGTAAPAPGPLDPWACPGHYGRRKVALRFDAVLRLAVHWAYPSLEATAQQQLGPHTVVVDAHAAWLKHARRAPWARALCGGDPTCPAVATVVCEHKRFGGHTFSQL